MLSFRGGSGRSARAFELALTLAHPVHDCLFVALAERLDRKLVAADLRFVRSLSGTALAGRVRSLSVGA